MALSETARPYPSPVPLSEDQRALLQLVLERGQSYEDIGSLLGLQVEEVRARARDALTEIGGTDPDAEVGLTDYLLGQADPIGRADVARHLQGDGETRDLAGNLVAQLRLLAPGATLPELPESRSRRGRGPAPAPAPARADGGGVAGEAAAPGGFVSSLSRRQRQLIGALLAVGALVVAVVLIATGVFGGDDETTSGPSEPRGGNGAGQADTESGITRAVLTPQGGGEATGIAVFARVRNVPVLNINLQELEPTPPGQVYVIWLFGSEQRAFPLTQDQVPESGRLAGAAPIPIQLLAALQAGTFHSVDVSLASAAEVRTEVRSSAERGRLPAHIGESVLRGRIVGPGFTAGGGAEEPANGGGGSPEG